MSKTWMGLGVIMLFTIMGCIDPITEETNDNSGSIPEINTEIMVNSAADKINNGDYVEALELLNWALEVNPKNNTLWCMKGYTLISLKRYDDAFIIVDKCRSSPLELEKWYCKECKGDGSQGGSRSRNETSFALREFSIGNQDWAFKIIDNLIDVDSNDYDAWWTKGIMYERLGDYDKALESYDKSINLFPFHSRVWYSKAHLLKELERYDEALKVYDDVIYFEPFDDYALGYKRSLLLELERYDEAAETTKKFIEYNQSDFLNWVYYGYVLYEAGRYDESLEAFNQANLMEPKHPGIYFWKGETLNKLEQFDELLEWSSEGLLLFPNIGSFWSHKGKALSGLERDSEALDAYDSALILIDEKRTIINGSRLLLNITEYDISYKKGIIYIKTGNYSKAIDAFDKELELNPNDEDAIKYRQLAQEYLANSTQS